MYIFLFILCVFLFALYRAAYKKLDNDCKKAVHCKSCNNCSYYKPKDNNPNGAIR